MAFLNRISGVLRQTVSKHMNVELSASNMSLYQAIRSMSSSKLFVGGLSWGTDEMSLREAFSQHGEVIEARVIMDRETGRSRGFGFVTYTSNEEASNAMQALDGQDLHGRRIRVNYANEKPRGGGFRGGYGNEGGNYGGAGGYGNNYGGAGGYGNASNYGGAGGYGNASNYGGAGGYGNASNYGNAGGNYDSEAAGGYGSSSFGGGTNYSDSGVSANSFDGTYGGGGAPAAAAAGDYFNSGSSNDGGFASAENTGTLGTSRDEDQEQLDPDERANAVDEFGDVMVEGNHRDDNDAPDDYANTSR